MADKDTTIIRTTIAEALGQTSVREEFERFGASVDGGKMLRGRLVLQIGSSNGTAETSLCRLAAAVELLHGASLLHDDVVDGGTERRHAPALWVSEGTKAAVLIGDLMLSVALTLVEKEGAQHLAVLMRALREMCDAEAEQEFSRNAHLDSWDDCVRIAQHKTGSLFGFAAACAGGRDTDLADALEQAGRDLGTAYQLADDMLDAHVDPALAGKSLGTDAATGKLTAVGASVVAGINPSIVIAGLLDSAEASLSDWPDVQARWRDYVATTIQPLVDQFTSVQAQA
ncbi:MAG: polyprenyl synthetase family protein [Kiritimatiellae bacterium]|nr:polyprenyl synthetase family protein [Kiritimatiellia bacterium]